MTVIAALPQETIDSIIDHLHSSPLALYACSLVCRHWRDASQHHLLSKIRCQGDAIARFADQLTRSSTFSANIRSLWIYGGDHGPTVSLSTDALVDLLAHIPNLRVLRVDRIALVTSDEPHTAGRVASPRFKLEHLDLNAVYQVTARRLRSVLAIFAELGRLDLQCIFTDLSDPSEEDVSRGAPYVGTACNAVVVDGRYPTAWAVRHALRYESLRSLTIKFPRRPDMPSVLEVLSNAAPYLEELILHLPSIQAWAVGWEQIEPLPWISLRSVGLVLAMQEGHNGLEAVHDVLEFLPDTVARISITVDESWYRLKLLGGLRWHDLEEQLSRFSDLKEVYLRLEPPRTDNSEALLDVAKRFMPTLAARGVLQ